jgi:hypothetical protein
MGYRRARNEVKNIEGAQTRVVSRVGTATAALVLLLGACGPAASVDTTTAPPTGTSPGAAGAPATAPGVTAPSTLPGAGVAGVKPGASTTTTGMQTSGAQPDGSGAPGAAPGAGAGIVPCAVNKVVTKNCTSCHGATPIGGAPMSLVTFADFHAPSKTMPSMKVFEVVKLRIHDTTRPMPPAASGVMPADQVAALDTWFAGGALTGPATDATCAADPTGPGTTSESAGGGSKDGSRGRLEPGPGATCYDFKVHSSQDKVDDTKFDIAPGEFYEQFYYNVPWPADQVATSYATVADNAQVLHHWLLFSTNETQTEGAHITAPLPTLIGTDPVLLAGWAVGGPNLVMPDDVGMELPNPGRTINVQWHFYNSTSTNQQDHSYVQICTVAKSSRPNIGGITWMGTEDLNGNVFTGGAGMPAKMVSTFTTNCAPGRGDIPIHIMGFEPHMHRLGKNMKTTVNHMGGMNEVIFDKPFSFGNETHYFEEYDLKPGETMTTSCTFDNDTDKGVPFGESTDTEMCYQFTFHYPAHSITNGAFSLLGVTDTCW